MRSLFLILSLTACGAARPVRPAELPARATIAPPLVEYTPKTEPEEEEAPTPTLRVTKVLPHPTASKTVAKPKLQGDTVDDSDGYSIDEPGQRPQLNLTGSPEVRDARVESAEASSTWSQDPSEPRPSALDPQARAAYKSAYRIYSERKPREALDAFAAFVLKYPDHPYVEQATFWRGECYAALGDEPHALEQFHGVIARFPGTPKAHEAEARIARLRGATPKSNSDQGSSR